MSMYHMVLGTHPLAPLLVRLLGFTEPDELRQVPRLRDLYLYPDEIRVLTRTGGGNRADYEEGNAYMETLPGYLRNWDDAYDCTYAWWAYSWPEEMREQLQEMLEVIQEQRPDLIPESNSMKERFDQAIEDLKNTKFDDTGPSD